MRRAFIRILALALLGAAPVGAAQVQAPEEANAESVEINPRYLLADGRGRPVGNEDFPGRFQLITFGYTFCPDVCPTTLATMTLILGRLGARAARLQPVFISVDPERDSAEAVERYTHYFDARILGLTGSPELVRRAAEHFKVTYRKYAEPGAAPGNYSIDHSAGMYLLGPDGNFITKFAHSANPNDTAARIDAIMAASRGSRIQDRR